VRYIENKNLRRKLLFGLTGITQTGRSRVDQSSINLLSATHNDNAPLLLTDNRTQRQGDKAKRDEEGKGKEGRDGDDDDDTLCRRCRLFFGTLHNERDIAFVVLFFL
jgi:hypothetical protein